MAGASYFVPAQHIRRLFCALLLYRPFLSPTAPSFRVLYAAAHVPPGAAANPVAVTRPAAMDTSRDVSVDHLSSDASLDTDLDTGMDATPGKAQSVERAAEVWCMEGGGAEARFAY